MVELVTITAKAKEHLASICRAEDVPAVYFAVKGGGCSGFTYQWELVKPDVFEPLMKQGVVIDLDDGLKLIIDDFSIVHVAGMEIDFETKVWGNALKLINPNATSQCGCGESFGV